MQVYEIKKIFESIFKPDNYYSIIDHSSEKIEIRVRDSTNTNCVDFTIKEPDELYIDFLSKCETSGTENLRKVLDFASTLKPKIKKVCLLDVSTIDLCDRSITLSLTLLRILTKGASWYNSFGFKPKDEDQYSYDLKRNVELISSNFLDVLNRSALYYFYEAYEEISFDEVNRLTDKEEKKKFVFVEIYKMIESALGLTETEISQLTVQKLFQGLVNYIVSNKNDCNNENFLKNVRVIKMLMNLISHFLSYSSNLCLNLDEKDTTRQKRALDTNSVFEANKKGGQHFKKRRRRKTKRRKTTRKLYRTTRRRFHRN